MSFNTAVSALMILANEMDKRDNLAKTYYEHFLKLLAPFAPHITEEIWANRGYKKSIHLEPWQKPMLSKIQLGGIVVIQVNGKVRGEVIASGESTEQEVKNMALSKAEIARWLEGKEVRRVIYIPGKLMNIVVG